jgi:hypothetical protein
VLGADSHRDQPKGIGMPLQILNEMAADTTTLVFGSGFVGLAFSFGVRALLRGLAKDSASGRTEDAEQNMIARQEVRIQALTTALDICYSERNKWAMEAAQVPLLRQRIDELKDELDRMHRGSEFNRRAVPREPEQGG